MKRNLLFYMSLAAGLLAGCAESNPQPAPAGSGDTSIEGMDGAADLSAGDAWAEIPADLPPDLLVDVPADVSPELPPDVSPDLAPDVSPDDLPPFPPDQVCVPECEGKECGPDGCGGSCGACDPDCQCGQGKCLGCGAELTCQQIYLCVYTCAQMQDYDVCPTQCLEGGSAAALDLWNQWVGCLEEQGYVDCVSAFCPGGEGSEGCDEAGLDECTGASWDVCEPGLLQCAHGAQTCGEVADCVAGCDPSEWLCRLLCLAHGSVEAQKAFDAWADCVAAGGACAGLWADCEG